MPRTRLFLFVFTLFAAATLIATAAWAGIFTASPPTVVSAAVSPFASCTADAGQTATNFRNTEVEPWVDVNPTNPNNIVATWQQDRWSDGGARGLVAGVSHDGGASWRDVVIPGVSTCSGNPSYLRASDPWLSFAPNGSLYHISLSANGGITAAGFPNSAILVSKSTDGGDTWGNPIALRTDTGPNILNDKESLTADPTSSNLVYAVWDRLEIANENADPVQVFLHAIGSRGPTWFSRTTNGGTSWEPARIIFDPGEVNQTIGNQIVVLPNGNVLDFFNVIFNFKNTGKHRGQNVAFISSTDKGATWSGAKIVDRLVGVTVRDPDTGQIVRTADFNPDVAVDPANGNIYVVWQDGRFTTGRSSVAFTMSTTGGATWSPTVKLNLNSGGTSGFLPSVHVAAGGIVGVSYYDFRNNTPAPGLPTDHWLLHCHSNCSDPASWSETHVDGGFDTENFPTPGNRLFPGDYLGLTAIGNHFGSLYIKPDATKLSADAFWATVGP
jgi:hypothetical protein